MLMKLYCRQEYWRITSLCESVSRKLVRQGSSLRISSRLSTQKLVNYSSIVLFRLSLFFCHYHIFYPTISRVMTDSHLAQKRTKSYSSQQQLQFIFNNTSLHSNSSVRIQIKEVTDVMRDNVHKVMERGERMEDLQLASDRLSSAGNEFREAARKAQRRAWMQNMRGRLIIIAITITAILCIVGEKNDTLLMWSFFHIFCFGGAANMGRWLVTF